MGLFNNIIDSFNSNEFSVSGNSKLKSISKEFKKNFDLTLVFYKGNMIADENLSFAKLNQKTSLKVDTSINNDDLKIKASMTVKEVEKSFLNTYGVKVQVKDKRGKNLVNDNFTLGDARRNEGN